MSRRQRRPKTLTRTSLENPSVPLSMDDDDGSGGRSSAGIRVTRGRVLGYPAAWRAVCLISGDIGKLPLQVYKLKGKNRQLDPKHPSYRLLLRKPNSLMTAFCFKQTLQAHALIHGNGYAYIDRDGGAQIDQLLILNPQKVTPIVNNGVLWYVYRPDSQQSRKLPATDVLHIKGLGYDGLQGYPVLQLLRDSFGVALAARDHAARYYKNGARPGGALKHPGKLSDPARRNMRESWERIHSGLEHAHKVAILEEGVEYIGFDSNAREAQLLESREFDAREIANAFGVPAHKLGDSSKTAYNSLEQENQSYYDDTLSRWLKGWAEEAHDKCLTEEEKADESHVVDWDYQELQRANLAVQVDFAVKAIGNGVMSPDEARATFGFNPRPDKLGDKYYMPANLVEVVEEDDEEEDEPPAPPIPVGPPLGTDDPAAQPVATPAATPAPDPAPDTTPATPARSDGLRLIVTDVVGRMARRLATAAERSKPLADHTLIVTEAFAPVVQACRDWGFNPPDPSDLAGQLFAGFDGNAQSQIVSQFLAV